MDSFVFERSDSVVLVWMVLAVTAAGIILAAAQLRASYLIAKASREAPTNDEHSDSARVRTAVHSSIVGVTILAMSFALFLTFVLRVYTVEETQQVRKAQSTPLPTAGRQMMENERLGIEPNFSGHR